MPRRPEFATILKTEGVDGLTSALNRRAEALAMSAAGTFWELPFEFPAAIQPCDMSLPDFRLRRNQLEAEKSDESAHD